MSKQGRVVESLLNSRNHSNTRSKSPQRSISPNSVNTHGGTLNHYKDIALKPIAKVQPGLMLKKKSLKKLKASSPMLGKSPSSSILVKNARLSGILSKKPSLKYMENRSPIMSNTPSVSYRSKTPVKDLEINNEHDFDEMAQLNIKKKPLNFEKLLEKYDMYKAIFEEIIQKDKAFTAILKKIKETYEEYYDFSIAHHTDKLKEKIDYLSVELSKKTEELVLFQRKIKKLSRENYDLAQSLERSEEICSGIQDRLNKISKFSIKDIAKDEETWKSLIIENEAYAISFQNLQAKLEASKENEKKLKQLLIEIKKSGFPVEDFYEKESRKKSKLEVAIKPAGSETSESDYLVSQRKIETGKLLRVPGIDIDKVEQEFSSSNSGN